MSLNLERFTQLCEDGFKKRNLDENLLPRLKEELQFISPADVDYALDLYDRKIRYLAHPNNFLFQYLLGIVKEWNQNQRTEFDLGDQPDIDTDIIDVVRDYLRDDWAPKTFGEKNVCAIGTYTTFTLKNSFIDMARVHGLDVKEINAITKKISSKDDEGKEITYEKALELYPELNDYTLRHPEVALAVQKIIHRNKGAGTHAAGVIISSSRIDDYIPLTVGKDGLVTSAWTEGLSEQDLAPMGIIKMDWLRLKDLKKIAFICNLVKQRHPEIQHISSDPDINQDWSDTAYLNDPDSLKLARKGDLLGIFQFDSPGIRELVKEIKVTSFEDLVVANSLYRPGPMGEGMHKSYARRKNKKEEYTIHPLLEKILGKTYGVMAYQEQVMKVLNVVGKIPLKDCEAVRKAISKKNIDKITEYKDIFIENGKELLGSLEEAEDIFSQVISYSGYGFNKSVDKSTLIPIPQGNKEIQHFVPGDIVYSIDDNGNTIESVVINLHDHGFIDGYEVTFDDGYSITCTLDHKFLTENGQEPLREIIKNNSLILCDPQKWESYNAKEETQWIESPMWGYITNSKIILGTLQSMFRMSRKTIYDWGVESTLWKNIQDTWVNEKAQGKMSGLSLFGVEDSREGWSNYHQRTESKMWFGTKYISTVGISSKDMSGMRDCQTSQYQSQEFEDESIEWASNCGFKSSEKNICKTRNSEGSCRTVTIVESKQSREICQLHRGDAAKSKKFQNGDMVTTTIGMGDETNLLRRRAKTSGLCERKYLDRSRWVLSFFRTSRPTRLSKEAIVTCSRSGRNVKQRSNQSWEYNIDPSQYAMFRLFYGGNEIRMVGLASEYATITNTRRLVSRRIVRIMPVGKRRMYDLEVACPTHNYLLLNGIVTSNSHAVAYVYISSRLLHLKVNFPIEFYAATLSSEAEIDKIKEYKRDAEAFGRNIKILPIDINKSKNDFTIDGNSIYYGFEDLKGVGAESAIRIAEGQPYHDLQDFLNKFGTDAKVCIPLIELGCFGMDRTRKLEYYKAYKDFDKKKIAKDKTFIKSITILRQEILDISGNKEINFDDPNWENEVYKTKEVIKVISKYKKRLESNKAAYVFDLNQFKLDLIEKPDDEYTERERAILLSAAEEKHYGFKWVHPIELCDLHQPDQTFEAFRTATELMTQNNQEEIAPVEVMVKTLTRKELKKKKTGFYYMLEVEDANSEINRVNVWQQDWERFGKLIKVGNIVRMQLVPPSGGFPNYSLRSWREFEYKWKAPHVSNDFRVALLEEYINECK